MVDGRCKVEALPHLRAQAPICVPLTLTLYLWHGNQQQNVRLCVQVEQSMFASVCPQISCMTHSHVLHVVTKKKMLSSKIQNDSVSKTCIPYERVKLEGCMQADFKDLKWICVFLFRQDFHPFIPYRCSEKILINGRGLMKRGHVKMRHGLQLGRKLASLWMLVLLQMLA